MLTKTWPEPSDRVMILYMQLNTHVTLDFIGVGADVDAGVDVGADAN